MVSAALVAPCFAEASDSDAVENNLVSNCGFETGEQVTVEGWAVDVEGYGGVIFDALANSGVQFIFIQSEVPGGGGAYISITQALTK